MSIDNPSVSVCNDNPAVMMMNGEGRYFSRQPAYSRADSQKSADSTLNFDWISPVNVCGSSSYQTYIYYTTIPSPSCALLFPCWCSSSSLSPSPFSLMRLAPPLASGVSRTQSCTRAIQIHRQTLTLSHPDYYSLASCTVSLFDLFAFSFPLPSPSPPPPTSSPSSSSSLGDPQFLGFRGQGYQFHGFPNTTFDVVSCPNFQFNALFVVRKEGVCPPKEAPKTLCFTHEGNYMGEVAAMINMPGSNQTTRILFQSGPANEGMKVWWDDEEVKPRAHHVLSLVKEDYISRRRS